MITGKNGLIEKWCNDMILGSGGLHDFEDHEFAVPLVDRDFEEHEFAVPLVDRDVAVAMWIVRCLGNGTSAETQSVVDAIVARRAKAEAKP